MSEHDPYVAERLRAAHVPHLDPASLIATATVAGRRTVRRRRIGTALASAAVVTFVGVGASAQLTGASAPVPDAAAPVTSPSPSADPDSGAEPVPYGGSWFSFIADEVTEREVGRIGDPEPVPTDAPSPAAGSKDEVEQFLGRDNPKGTFVLDGIATTVDITWGAQTLTPEEAAFFNRTLSEEMRGDDEVVAEGYSGRTLAHCRALHEKGTDYRRGTCRRGPDGTAWVSYAFQDGPDENQDRAWEIRGAVVYRLDEWVLSIEQRSGGLLTPPFVEKMASPKEMYAMLREGEWFR